MSVEITAICLGNICRSPLAEVILRAELSDLDVVVDSAGTGGWHIGDDADHRSRAAAARAGYPMAHRARQTDRQHLAAKDLVLVMDLDNYREVVRMLGSEGSVHLLRSFDADADAVEVPDPYYGTAADFDAVVAMIQAAVPGLREFLVNEVFPQVGGQQKT